MFIKETIFKKQDGLGGQDSSVDVANSYGLYGSGFESQWRQDFPHICSSALGPTQLPVQRISFLPGIKWPECEADHPPPFSTKVKERLEPYVYSSGPSWSVVG